MKVFVICETADWSIRTNLIPASNGRIRNNVYHEPLAVVKTETDAQKFIADTLVETNKMAFGYLSTYHDYDYYEVDLLD